MRLALPAAVLLLAVATNAAPQGIQERPLRAGHAFYFTRAVYSDFAGGGRRFRGSWATDYPKADVQFLIGLTRLTRVDAFDGENAVRLDDPALRRFPMIYAVEVGRMDLTDAEAGGLRDYLLAGGLLVVDDFWGTQQWANFEQQMRRVLPEYPIREIPPEHPVRRTVYEIDSIVQVPSIGNARRGYTSEYGGVVPHLRGITDATGRLLVLISFNSDLGDAWEWAEQPDYPLVFSNYAFRIGVNMVVFGMVH